MVFKSILCAICTCLSVFSFNVNAAIISDTNFTISGDYTLNVDRGVSDCCTSMWFSKVDNNGSYNYLDVPYNGDYSTLTYTSTTVDINPGYFLVSYGDEFTAATIAGDQFQPFLVSDVNQWYSSTPIDVPFGDFYLGVALDNNIDFEYTEFGWIHLSNSASGLSMISSAMAYGEIGIVIGTTEAVSAVPIPSAIWLFSSGVIGLIGFARRKTRN